MKVAVLISIILGALGAYFVGTALPSPFDYLATVVLCLIVGIAHDDIFKKLRR